MKRLFFSFLILSFSVWLGFLIHQDPGYILITYRSWSIETSLWVGFIVLALLFFILYLLIRFLSHTSNLGKYISLWNKERKERKASKLINQAIEALIETRWSEAESFFSKSAKNSISPVLSYLGAAWSAQQQKAYVRRDQHIKKLFKIKTPEKIVKIAQIYFYLQSNQWNKAEKLLHPLRKDYPTDSTIIRLLIRSLEKQDDWRALKNLLEKSAKYITPEERFPLEKRIYMEFLTTTETEILLDEIWKKIPKELRTDQTLIASYAKKAKELNHQQQAISLLENSLKKKGWSAGLIELYGLLTSNNINKQIYYAESWLKKYPNDPNLLLCLGRLCIKAKQWGKARDYLQDAFTEKANPEIHYELGQLFESLNEPTIALEHYRAAAQKCETWI